MRRIQIEEKRKQLANRIQIEGKERQKVSNEKDLDREKKRYREGLTYLEGKKDRESETNGKDLDSQRKKKESQLHMRRNQLEEKGR